MLATTRYNFMLWSFDVAIDEGVYLVILSLVTKLPGLISETLIIESLCVFFKHLLIVPFIISLTFVVCFCGILLLLALFVLICCPFVWNLKKLRSFYSSQMLWFSKQVYRYYIFSSEFGL